VADPKIRYDIEAGVKGEEDVDALQASLRELGNTLDGPLKQKANEAADALQQLGAKREAVATFQQLTNESNALAFELAQADAKVDQLAQSMPQAAAAAQRFAQAEAAARTQLDQATADFTEQSQALAKLRQDFTGAARGSDEYKQANAQLRQSVKDLKTNLDEKKAALQAAAAQTTSAGNAERKLASDYQAAAQGAFALRGAVQDNSVALGAASNALQAHGLATDNLAQAERNLAAGVGQVRDRVAELAPKFAAAAAASGASTQKQVTDQHSVATAVKGVQDELRRVQTIASVAIGGGVFGGLIKDVAQTADEFKNLQARIKLATGEGTAFEQGFKGVQAVALSTNASLEETATLFARITKAGTDAGLTSLAATQQALGLTETINQAVALSGSGADASKAAITQLIQGLQSGVLRGEEFNSVMEQAPRLAQALAQGLNVTTGELRKLAGQGTLTTDAVIRALTSQAAAVQSEFGKLPATVGRALQNLSTQWSLYVGASDNGMVSSANLAKVIDGLANNLDGLVSALTMAGKAWAAIKIAGLAGDVLRWATSTATATTAVQANTTAVGANTAAHVANAAAQRASATAGSAAAATGGVLASGAEKASAAVSSLGGFLLRLNVYLAVLANSKSIGTWLGETAAKWAGYGEAIEKANDATKRQEIASKLAAEQQRDLTIALQAARDKQFELSKESTGLIGKFDELRGKGESAADAIAKVGKDFDLANIPGIRDAGAVLDKLQADGKLTATQFQKAWADALKGEDLGKFEFQAREAFRGAAREGERLAAVFDGTAREAIRRTGLEFDVLAGGIGQASRSAINDTQAIIDHLEALKTKGVDVGLALTSSLAKSIDTADSVKSLDALRGQIESVRAQLGNRVADGLLDQATVKAEELRAKIENLKPGIQSAAEALRFFGLQSAEALTKAANSSREAFDTLKQSGTASADQLRQAFNRVAADATAANKGIAPSWLATEDAMIRSKEAVDGFGQAAVDSYGKAGRAAKEFQQIAENIALNPNADRRGQGPGVIGPNQEVKSVLGNTREEKLAGQNAVDMNLQFQLRDRLKAGTLGVDDLGAIKTVIATLKQQNEVNGSASKLSAGFMSTEGLRAAAGWQATRAQLEALVKQLESPARSSSTHTVELTMPDGSTGTFNVASEEDANRLIAVLGAAKGRSS
jgi:tape measure domain-containing protein